MFPLVSILPAKYLDPVQKSSHTTEAPEFSKILYMSGILHSPPAATSLFFGGVAAWAFLGGGFLSEAADWGAILTGFGGGFSDGGAGFRAATGLVICIRWPHFLQVAWHPLSGILSAASL